MSKKSALRALVALCVLLAAPGVDLADASIQGVASTTSTTSVSSAEWSVAAVATPSDSLPALTGWTNSQGVSSKSFYLKNFGSLTTANFTVTLITGAATSTLQRCSLFGVGVSPDTNTACNGGSWVSMATPSGDNGGEDQASSTASAFLVVSIALPANSWLFVRVLDSQPNKSDSISVSITNTGPIAGIRAATTTNS